jgi:hypothetical protein
MVEWFDQVVQMLSWPTYTASFLTCRPSCGNCASGARLNGLMSGECYSSPTIELIPHE